MKTSTSGILLAVLLVFVIHSTDGASVGDVINAIVRQVHSSDNQLVNRSTSADTMHEVADKDKTSSAHALSRVRRWTNQDISTLQKSTNNLQTRSVCPWTYSYNVDPLRQPSSLIQATCKQVIVPGTSAQCEHVYYPVPVKQNVSGTIVDTWYTLKVGCVLAKRLSVPAIPIN